jgi:hypothetical protein
LAKVECEYARKVPHWGYSGTDRITLQSGRKIERGETSAAESEEQGFDEEFDAQVG